jgi:hypothetical protein
MDRVFYFPFLYVARIVMGPKKYDSDNGILSAIFGPPAWVLYHSITFNFPVNPSAQQKRDYLHFFKLVGKTLPCSFCRSSFYNFTKANGPAPLTMRIMKSRDTLSRWLHKVHDLVNKRLHKPNGPSYECIRSRYETYRAHTCSNSDKNTKNHQCKAKRGYRKKS